MPSARFIGLCLLSCCLMQPVYADDVLREEVFVTGQRLQVGSESNQELIARLARVPGGTNVITFESRPQLNTLSDMFAYEPGVLVQEFFGGFDQPRLNIRGSGLQSNPVSRGVLLLQDYLPLNDADGSFIIGWLQPLSTRAMTVHRGANSRVPGAVTLGGDINMISYTGEESAGDLRLDAGEDGRQGAHVNYGDTVGDLDYFVSAGANEYDGFRNHSETKRQNFSTNAGYAFSDNLVTRTYVNYTDSKFDLPFVLTEETAKEDPESVIGDGDSAFDRVLNIYQRNPYRDFTTWRVANRTQYKAANHAQTFGVWWQKTDDQFVDPLAHTVSDIDTQGAQWLLDLDRESAGYYQLGLEWSRSGMPREYYVNNAADGSRGFQFGDLDLDADNAAISLRGDYPLNAQWSVDSQLQWVHASRNSRNKDDATQVDQDWNSWLPKLGINYQQSADTRWFANVSTSKEPPTFYEIAQAQVPPVAIPGSAVITLNELEDQQAVTLEIGGRGALSPALGWDLAIYRSAVQDEILSVASTFGVIAQSSNYDDKTVHQGVELGLYGQVPVANDFISYQAAWNYSDFYFQNGVFDGNQIAGAPKSVISGAINYQRGQYTLGISGYSQPDNNYVDHANTLKQDSFFLLGLNAVYQPSARLKLYVTLNNATDKNYNAAYVVRDQSTANLPTFLPGNGRNLNGGVIYSW